jgi:hypothetical protein
MVRRVLILAALLLALTPEVARATTYYARSHGSETGVCPVGEECTLRHAVSLAGDGDSIVLEPGAAFTPADTPDVKHAVDIGGTPGAVRPTIAGPEEESAIELSGGAHLHDVNIVAFEAFAALQVEAGSAERVLVEATGPGTRGCDLVDATLIDSVCRATGPAVTMEGGAGVATLRNVTAASSEDEGILVESPGKFKESRLEGVNVIARGAAGGFDVSAVVSAGEGAARVFLTSSDYGSIQATGGEGSVTPPGTNGNITAARPCSPTRRPATSMSSRPRRRSMPARPTPRSPRSISTATRAPSRLTRAAARSPDRPTSAPTSMCRRPLCARYLPHLRLCPPPRGRRPRGRP